MNFFQLLLISVTCNVTANILLKSGVTKLGGITLEKVNIATELFKVVLNPQIIGGLILYGFSFVIWLRVLTFNDLSRAYPIFVTFVFLLTTLGSVRFLGESISPLRILGILISIAGIYLIAHS